MRAASSTRYLYVCIGSVLVVDRDSDSNLWVLQVGAHGKIESEFIAETSASSQNLRIGFNKIAD